MVDNHVDGRLVGAHVVDQFLQSGKARDVSGFHAPSIERLEPASLVELARDRGPRNVPRCTTALAMSFSSLDPTPGALEKLALSNDYRPTRSDVKRAHQPPLLRSARRLTGTRMALTRRVRGKQTARGCFERNPLLHDEGSVTKLAFATTAVKKRDRIVRRIRRFEHGALRAFLDFRLVVVS